MLDEHENSIANFAIDSDSDLDSPKMKHSSSSEMESNEMELFGSDSSDEEYSDPDIISMKSLRKQTNRNKTCIDWSRDPRIDFVDLS